MKKLLSTLFLILVIVKLNGQVATIIDIQGKGVDYYDTTTTGHNFKEVFIEKGLTARKSKFVSLPCDTCNTFRIAFINLYNDSPVKYSIIHTGTENFDSATYTWLNDSIVSVTLFESATKQSKEYKLGIRENRTLLYGDFKEK